MEDLREAVSAETGPKKFPSNHQTIMANGIDNDWEDDCQLSSNARLTCCSPLSSAAADLLSLVDVLLRRFSNLNVAGNRGPNTPERRGTSSGIGRRGPQVNTPARSSAQGAREGAVTASLHEPQGEASVAAGITNNNGMVKQNVVINIFNTPSYSSQHSLAVAPTSPQHQHVQHAREVLTIALSVIQTHNHILCM